MRFYIGISIVATALEIRVHRPICLANESLLIYGIYELQTLVSVLIYLHARLFRIFSAMFYEHPFDYVVSLITILYKTSVLYIRFDNRYNIFNKQELLLPNVLRYLTFSDFFVNINGRTEESAKYEDNIQHYFNTNFSI